MAPTPEPPPLELSSDQSKYPYAFIGLVAPSRPALEHPATPMLLEFATKGCNAAIEDKWNMGLIKAALTKGAHPSALQPEPAVQLHAETLEKVEQGYMHLVNF